VVSGATDSTVVARFAELTLTVDDLAGGSVARGREAPTVEEVSEMVAGALEGVDVAAGEANPSNRPVTGSDGGIGRDPIDHLV
jgi:hypothetical protein